MGADRRVGRPRPWALAILWVILMTPLSLAGTAAQPHTGIPYEVFPLVMAGPALSALACRLLKPHWFPCALPAAPRPLVHRSLTVTSAAGVVFGLCSWWWLASGPPMLPQGWPRPQATSAMVVGLTLGSLLEEIGYRGVMYRALATRMRPVAATVVNGVFFGLAHLQYLGAGALAGVLFVTSAVLMDVVMVALWTGSWRQRLGVATLFHAVADVTLALVGDAMTTLPSFAAVAAAAAVAAVLAVLAGRRLSLGDYGHPTQPARQQNEVIPAG